jgi:hypothetical protein
MIKEVIAYDYSGVIGSLDPWRAYFKINYSQLYQKEN